MTTVACSTTWRCRPPRQCVAQLVRQQKQEALERERVEQELRSPLIQETLLPKTLPQIDQYSIAAFWQPARRRWRFL